MPNVKILQGIPCSGKSTWSKNFTEKNKDWIRVSRDDLRNMRGIYWNPKQENLITLMEYSLIEISLKEGYNVIVDATNLNPEHLKNLKNFILNVRNDVNIEIKRFDIELEEAIKRDIKRPNGVGETVIRTFYDKYINPPVPKLNQDINLRHAIICDIDGTVAQMVSRNPYEWDKVITDIPKMEIIHLVKMYYDMHYKIIFFTGRDGNEECTKQTIEWLEKYLELEYKKDFELYIRKENDNRKDSIIKKEMFEEHIRDKYFIELVIDDRNSVVKAWRDELGLTCLQVDWGQF